MILRVFRSGQPYVLVVIAFFSALLWLNVFLAKTEPQYTATLYQMPLYDIILSSLKMANSNLLLEIFAFFLIYLQGIFIAKIDHRFGILRQYTYATTWVYVFLISAIVDLQSIHPLLFASFFLLWATYEVLNSANQKVAHVALFKAGLAIAIGSLFYLNLIFYLLFIFSGIIFFRAFDWKEWVAVFLGFFSAYLIFFELYYILADNFLDVLTIIVHNLLSRPLPIPLQPVYKLAFLLIAVVIVLASISIWSDFVKLKINVRKYYRMFFILFLLTVVFFIFFRNYGYELYLIASISMAYLIGRYIIFMKNKKMATYILYYLIAIILFVQAVKWELIEIKFLS